MMTRTVRPRAASPRRSLEEAPRVAGRDDLRAGGGDPVELSGEELSRDLGLQQVVDPGGAAAEVGLGELDQPETGDRAEESPRRLPHALAVRQVTGLVVRHREVERPPRPREVLGQELGDVAHPRGQGERLGVVAQEVSRSRAARPAAGRVRDDPVGVLKGRQLRRARCAPPPGRPSGGGAPPQHPCPSGTTTR